MSPKPKILIIDDDQELATLLATQLRPAGYPTMTALDAVQGFMFAQRELPGLILLDLKMPAGSGLDLLDKLRKNIRTQLVPVIVMSATPAAEVESQVLAKGAAGFLQKPIEPARLLSQVEQVLSQS